MLLPYLPLPIASPPLGFSVTLFGAAVELAGVLALAAENQEAAGLGNRQIPLRLLRVLQTHAVAGTQVTSEVLGLDGLWRSDALADLAATWRQAPAGSVLLRCGTRLRLKAGSGVLK